jgi:hypothetical protein
VPDLLSPAGLEQSDKLPQTRLNLAAALVAGTIAFGAGQASAMPAFDHAVTKATQAVQPEQVRWGLRALAILLAAQLFLPSIGIRRPAALLASSSVLGLLSSVAPTSLGALSALAPLVGLRTTDAER